MLRGLWQKQGTHSIWERLERIQSARGWIVVRPERLLAMSANSLIEWTDNTWNPVRGCSKVSPGCAHCYAEAFAERFRGVPGNAFEQGFDVRLAPWKLLVSFQWTSSKRVFVNSMSDLFHDEVPDRYIVAAFEVMAAADWHTYQILTKRPERMQKMLKTDLEFAANLPHIWWGVTVENKRHGLPRLDCLQECDVAMRFLSCEPLLEDLGTVSLDGINWVIVGGESGPGARPVGKEWIVSLRDQCKSVRVPFYFKQWGGFPKGKLGCVLDGKEYKAIPPMRELGAPSLIKRGQIETELHKQLWAVGILELAA
jgi:protein gp37